MPAYAGRDLTLGLAIFFYCARVISHGSMSHYGVLSKIDLKKPGWFRHDGAIIEILAMITLGLVRTSTLVILGLGLKRNGGIDLLAHNNGFFFGLFFGCGFKNEGTS
ncbi:hypothetical protein GGR50DRAFT_626579 [Xylaria sp. CBS 124048]|nr:hypothetical protein GGR50DRAFT_626579 [Xylaria sp. CBS 124048]